MAAMRAWLVLVIAAGCYDDPVRHCPVVDCPTTMVCDNAGGCAFEEQLEQCAGQPDGTACAYPGVANGECKSELCIPAGCGNGIQNSDEVCDDGNTTNGDGCSADCRSLETCGNAIPDFAAGETCDCGASATAAAPASCNGLPNSDSDLDAPCRANCQLRRCGDGTLDQTEQCEGANLDGKTCGDLGFYAGTLACSEFCTFDTSSCSGTCGDGLLEVTEEQCDTEDFGTLACQAFGFQTGTLACNAGCAVDTSGCSGRCGDDLKNGTEQCDGEDVGTTACTDVGFYGGELGCSSSCSFDTSACIGRCGDDALNGPEQCDGADLDGADCTDAGFYGGTLTCNPICGFNTSGCVGRCGDSIVNGPEQCDKLALANQTCANFGFQGGQLRCNANCGFDTSGCTGFCGDGAINTGEDCDDTNFNGQSCQTLGFYTGQLSCTGACTVFAGACDGFCGDGEINGPDVDQLERCDKDDLGGVTCASLDPEKFASGVLGCSPRCDEFDTKNCAIERDGKCDVALGENCTNSPDDCTGEQDFCCPNNLCSPAETPETCPADCAK
jgi:cysteine-rich repeat protein